MGAHETTRDEKEKARSSSSSEPADKAESTMSEGQPNQELTAAGFIDHNPLVGGPDEQTMNIQHPDELPSASGAEVLAKRPPQLTLIKNAADPETEVPDGPIVANPPASWPFGNDSDISLLENEPQAASAQPKVESLPPKAYSESTSGAIFGVEVEHATEDVDPAQLPPSVAERLQPNRDVLLRRDESVLADLEAARGGTLHRVRDQSMAALRRFESLPRRKQLLWVMAPYAGALLLIVLLLYLRSPEPTQIPTQPTVVVAANGASPEAAPVEPAGQPEKTAQPEATAQPENAVQPEDTANTAEAAAKTTPAAANEAAAVIQAALAKPEPSAAVQTQIHKLPIRASLFVRQDGDYKRAARLRAGAEVIVFTNFPTDEGWVLAQSSKGTIGFLPAANLKGERDPELEPTKKPQRRTRRRRRR